MRTLDRRRIVPCTRSVLAPVALALALTPALASDKDDPQPGANARPTGAWVALEGADRGPVWAAFEARYGLGWSLYVDPHTGTPSLLAGPGIDLGRKIAADDAGIARARALIEELADVLGVADPSAFVLERAVAVENPWGQEIVTINFKQTCQGLDVWHQGPKGTYEHLAMVRFVINGTIGRVAMLGSDAVRDLEVPAETMLDESEARSAATRGLAEPGLHRVDTRSYVSVRAEGRRLVREVRLFTALHTWRLIHDALTGELIERTDEARSVDIGGQMLAGVVEYPSAPFTAQGLPSMRFSVTQTGQNGVTDERGLFRFDSPLNPPLTITSRLLGDWANVQDVHPMGGGNLAFSTNVTVPSTSLSLNYYPAHASEFSTAETTAYYWVNRSRWMLRRRIPAFNGLVQFRAEVNSTLFSCNAHYLGDRIRFYPFDGTCNNSAHVGDVVAHEYGHAFHAWFHGTSRPEGFSEGIGDMVGLYLTQQRVLGRNFFVNGNNIRDYRPGGGANNRQYNDPVCNEEEHCLGEAWCGFTLDLRDNLRVRLGSGPGIDCAERIVLGQFVSNPADEVAAVANVFTYDDDDANLTNGTPDCADIRAAAQRHSFPIPSSLPANCGTGPSPTTAALTNGPGNGSISVTVDGYGNFGATSGRQLSYDDLGANGPRATTSWSAVLFRAPDLGVSQWLSSSTGFSASPLPPIAIGPGNTSTWNISGFRFNLTQRLTPIDPDGSTLQQVYEIANLTGAPQELQMVRYADFDVWSSSGDDGVGVSDDYGLTAGNDHMVFAYDAPGASCVASRPLLAISAEGKDAAGNPVNPCGWEARPHPVLRDALGAQGCASLTRFLHNDGNGDRLVCSETVYDVTMATGVRFLDVPSGGTVRFHTRTRILERTPETGNRLVRTARIGAMPAGQLVLRSTIPPVNGCIQPGGPAVAIQVQSPVGGPDPAHWILYGVVGRVNTLEACGAPIAPDVSEWFLGAGSLGLAAFPLRGSFFGGTGGGSSVTPVPLISSVPLAALLPGPPAVPAFNTIVNLPVVPFSYTLQGVMQDATSPGGFRVTNALEVSGTACTCQP